MLIWRYLKFESIQNVGHLDSKVHNFWNIWSGSLIQIDLESFSEGQHEYKQKD